MRVLRTETVGTVKIPMVVLKRCDFLKISAFQFYTRYIMDSLDPLDPEVDAVGYSIYILLFQFVKCDNLYLSKEKEEFQTEENTERELMLLYHSSRYRKNTKFRFV